MRADERGLAYGGGWLDRAAELRGDANWLAERRTDPASVVLPCWRDRCLVDAGRAPVRPTVVDGAGLLAAADETVFLGLDAGRAVFAADLSGRDEGEARELAGAVEAVDVRALVGGLTPAEAALQAYAKGLLHWHRGQRFCGACGAATVAGSGGHVRSCTGPGCARLFFPRIEPAVIVLVEVPGEPERCLLGRHRGAAEDAWSLLAGFVEIGESLEDAVRRELAEEVGVSVRAVTYQGSQAWPFPAGLMVGFRATAVSTRVRVDDEELVAARWFTRAELRARVAAGHPLGRVDSIDSHLLESWLDERG